MICRYPLHIIVKTNKKARRSFTSVAMVHTHTNTHTHIYIYIYKINTNINININMCVCARVCAHGSVYYRDVYDMS